MKYQLFTRVALKTDLPDHRFRAGDVATVVEYHPGRSEQGPGYSLEVFNAVGETLAVVHGAGIRGRSFNLSGTFTCAVARDSTVVWAKAGKPSASTPDRAMTRIVGHAALRPPYYLPLGSEIIGGHAR